MKFGLILKKLWSYWGSLLTQIFHCESFCHHRIVMLLFPEEQRKLDSSNTACTDMWFVTHQHLVVEHLELEKLSCKCVSEFNGFVCWVLFNWLKFLRFVLHMLRNLPAFTSTTCLLKGACLAHLYKKWFVMPFWIQERLLLWWCLSSSFISLK